jgi:hypothetical protein
MRRRTWLILAIIVIPLWLLGAGGEIADAFLIRKEGRVTMGRVNPGKWIRSRGGLYQTEVSYIVNDRELRKEFRVPRGSALQYVNENGDITNPNIEVLYAPSKPQVAELVVMPTDAPWIGILVASIGFCVISGVFAYLYRTAKK